MTALITGASSGIGAEFARQLAARGEGLVLVARRRDRLDALAAEATAAHRVHVDVLTADLAAPDAAADLWTHLIEQGVQVDTLVNNAGFGTHGPVVDEDPTRLEEEVRLNCGTLTGLAVRAAADMRRRGRGSIVNIASTAAFQPVPNMAVYCATKAYVLSFSEALWAELRPHGVRVLALCPGPTSTEFFDIAGEGAQVGRMRPAPDLVRSGLRALDRGTPSHVHGLDNALTARVAARLAPRRLLLSVAGRLASGRASGPRRATA